MNNIKKPQNTTPQNTPALKLTLRKLNKQTRAYHKNGINTKPPQLLPLNEAKQPQNRTLLTRTQTVNNKKHAKLTSYGAQHDAKKMNTRKVEKLKNTKRCATKHKSGGRKRKKQITSHG